MGQGVEDEVTLEDWRKQLSNIIPNMHKCSTLTAIYIEEGSVLFLYDGQETGRISDPEFAKAFFNVWLGEDTFYPDLRAALVRKK